MPPKDIEILSDTLYLNNESIMKLDKCDLVCEEPIYADELPKVMKFSESKEVTIENVKINRNTLLSLLYGRKVTNNWLKMHGGVMSRKKGRKR